MTMKIRRPSLIVQSVTFHEDDCKAARELGGDLYAHLTRPLEDPLSIGAGLPIGVGIAAERADLSAAECLVLVPVLGPSSFQQNRETVIERLREWHQVLGPGHVLAVPTSEVWRDVEGRFPGALLLTELYGKRRRGRTLDEIVLAVTRLLDPDSRSVPLFISHAKADLSSTEEAAKKIYQHVVNDGTGSAFFDATGIEPGISLVEQIDKAAGRGIFLVVRSDSYSSRVWCQRELLIAKKGGLPTLTVEMLATGEHRILPYGGNGPSMVWKGAPAAVVSRAMVEWLRAEHFRREAARIIEGAGLPLDVETLARPPELLDFAQGPLPSDHRARLVLHPDPELPTLEAEVLARARPRLRLATPTTVYRRLLSRGRHQALGAPLDGLQIGMSLSESPDVDGPEGYTAEHLRDATVYLARSLISAGAAIAYGGDFRRNGFTPLLAELIRAYNQTARAPAQYLHSYLAAHLEIGEAGDLPLTMHHLLKSDDVQADALLVPGSTEPAPPLALYFSDMRRVMALHIDAQVVLGGAAEPQQEEEEAGYTGRVPGVVEEAWRVLEAGKPLYVAGGFGGAAALVTELLLGEEVPERLQDETWSSHELYRKRSRAIDTHPAHTELGLPGPLEELAKAVQTCGHRRLASDEAALAWNGLTVEENHVLFRTRDPVTLTTLVIQGLLRWSQDQSEGRLEIELVEGSVTQARELDAVAVATFDNVPLGGAGEAIDRELGGAASRRRLEGERLTAITVETIDADWLYLASLGPLGDIARLGDRVEAAARYTAELARRHGFGRLGLVAYGGSVVQDLDRVVTAMLQGLGELAGRSVLCWFESDHERFERLRELLEKRSGVKLTTRRLTVDRPTPMVQGREAYLQVSLESGVLNATFLPPSGIGIGSTHRLELSEELLDSFAIGEGDAKKSTPSLATLATRGTELAKLLLGEEAPEMLARCDGVRLVIVHDPAASKLPFEILTGKDPEHAPAVRGGISRRLAVEGVTAERLFGRPPVRGPLRMLLVIDPRENLPGARKEGEAVEATIKSLKHDGSGGPDRIELKVLRGREATLEEVRRLLPQVDILHYCGHAAFAGPGADQSGLFLADSAFLTLDDLREIELPRVAFVNSCEIGRVRGPFVTEAASFAEFFLRAGVEAYLGTFWRVQDEAAVELAIDIYTHLAMGKTLEAAVTAARSTLLEWSPPQQDWANYILYGDGHFRLVAD